jgi:hypothetical protein
MHTQNLTLRTALAIVATISVLGAFPQAFADCSFPNDGKVVDIKVESCEVIDGKTNKDVLKYAGASQKTQTIQKLYTGALVTAGGVKWMYPSEEINPCQKIREIRPSKDEGVPDLLRHGGWGKCVFGGRWLGEVNGKPVNSDQ